MNTELAVAAGWPPELAPFLRGGGDLCPDRRRFVTASEVGPVCGVSPWQSPWDIWQSKGQTSERTPTTPMLRGTILEPLIGYLYQKETGVEITPATEFAVHPEHEHYGASPDFLTADDRVVEAKSADYFAFQHWGGQPPLHYVLQTQAQLACTGREAAVLAVLVGDRLHHWEIEGHAPAQQRVFDEVSAFWRSVEEQIQPTADPKRDAAKIAAMAAVADRLDELGTCDLCGPCQKCTAAAPCEKHAKCARCHLVNDLARRYAGFSKVRRDADKRLRVLKAEILQEAGEFAGLMTRRYVVKVSPRKGFAVKASVRAPSVQLVIKAA